MDFSQGEPDLFKIENTLVNKNLPISLFQEIEADLCDKLLYNDSLQNDQTDGLLEFIQGIVEKIKEEFEGFVEDGDKKTFLAILSKIFTILLSVKAENTEKIIKIVRSAVSIVLKTWSGQNLFQESNGRRPHQKVDM